MIPLSLTLNVDLPGNRFKPVAEVQCFKMPRKIADKYFHMSGGDYWYLHRVWVDEKYRRKGLATQLMHDLVRLTESRGVSLVLKINPMSEAPNRAQLMRFYRSFGFKRVRNSDDLMEKI